MRSAAACSAPGQSAAMAAPRARASPPCWCRAAWIWPTSGGIDTVPEKYRGRNLYEWNPNVTLLRTNVEENQQDGRNARRGGQRGHRPGGRDPAAQGRLDARQPGRALLGSRRRTRPAIDAISKNLRPGIPVIEVDHNINDPEFADLCANTLLETAATR